MNLSLFNLTKNHSNIIKAFAILIIVLHNFLHLTNRIGENELSLNPNRIYTLFHSIKMDFTITFNALFSYFGHYGVQLFIFISGYGLTKQCMKKGLPSYKKFVMPKILKIYSLLLTGLIFYILLYILTNNTNLVYFGLWIISELLMINNFFYDRIFIFAGPWWYFSLAIQLYLIFPFLYKFINYKKNAIFILLSASYVLIYLLFPITEKYNIPLYGIFIGHLPEFILGIGFAKFPQWRIDLKILIIMIVLFGLSNFYYLFYPFSFLSITIILLCFCNYILFKLPNSIKDILLYIGHISMFIFVVNGPIRNITLPYLVSQSFPILTFFGSTLHFIFVLFAAILMSYIYKKTALPLLKYFTEKIK